MIRVKSMSVTKREQTMLRRLFGYMAALIVVVIVVMLASLSLMGRFHTDKAELIDTLEPQMDFWEKTIVARSDALAAVGIDDPCTSR